MATTQYIGARYVPVFADPVEWSSAKAYEPLTIVLHEGNSYTSRQYVPVGVDIVNADFWVETGNYNAQVELYRREVLDYRDYFTQKPFAFETVEYMQRSDALYAGAICHTNGFHTSGDGGAAWYVISNTGTANGMDVLECNNLRAHLVTETCIIPEQFGAFSDGATDSYHIFQYLVDNFNNIVANGTYLISQSLVLSNDNQSLTCNGTIIYNGNDSAIIIKNKNSKYIFNNISAPNGNGITFSQIDLDYSLLVGYCYLEIGSIDAGINGIQFLAGNHGVLDINVRVKTRVHANQHGIYMYAGDAPSTQTPSYVGEILIEGGLIYGVNGYGAYLDASNGYQITGVTFQNCSMEHSANAIMHAGGLIIGCVYNNLRVSEIQGIWLNINGNTRNCIFVNEQSVALDKIINNSTALEERSMVVDAPIATTGGSVFGDKLKIVKDMGVSCISVSLLRYQNVSDGYTWDISKVTPTAILFGHSSAIVKLSDIPYFNPYGLTELIVQGFNDCTAKITDDDDNTIIDFANYSTSGYHCIKCYKGSTTSAMYRVVY